MMPVSTVTGKSGGIEAEYGTYLAGTKAGDELIKSRARYFDRVTLLGMIVVVGYGS